MLEFMTSLVCTIYYLRTNMVSEKNTTYMALLNLVDQVSNEHDRKHYSLGILYTWYLSKAFDILDHKILIYKLCH